MRKPILPLLTICVAAAWAPHAEAANKTITDYTDGAPLVGNTDYLLIERGGIYYRLIASGVTISSLSRISGWGLHVASALGASATGTLGIVRKSSATLIAPTLGTPAQVNLTNASAMPAAQITGTLGPSHGGMGTSSAPVSAQIPVGDAGGTAYSPKTISGDISMTNAGVVTVSKINGSSAVGIKKSGTVVLSAKTLATASCFTEAVTASATLAKGNVIWSPEGNLQSKAGYKPSGGGLAISVGIASGTVTWQVCNTTASSRTSSAVTLNYTIFNNP